MTNETVGERIRRVRIGAGLSQADLQGPGVSAQYLSKIERGQRSPSMKALRRVAPKLGVSPEYLETGRTDPLAAALTGFVRTIEACGGVFESESGARPVGDPDWLDLGAAYLTACDALGRTPTWDVVPADEDS
jgi:transcriptional regulator with XRE-family HTH domain